MDFLSLQSTNDSECEQEKEDDSIFESIVGTKYTVLADKGTFDAISLKPESNENSNIRDKRCEKDLKLTPEPAAEVEVEDGIEGTIKIETSARIAYINSVKKLLDPGGVFVITSCNWTQNELVNIFSNDFVAVDFIKHTNFTFGGQKGQCVSSVVFKHRQWAAENSI
ncbi:Protein-lysine N-methyltransferase mettl10 [Zancudomyces culisetae]|uniref:Protein-lysine N-methyltransferase mettl10 n=1 Tax=Zancudomyces culisetae TaxID=1213189 RepID=A0A1R1PKR0_ZANCU|nr:Protein-lysine N-methyltransferase mettl10 [Zancudomyces culisetae]|eukprot:OMH81568.1 Protein-lysine N-methyltransferase mettl10 [Zancudomyces culisetae]